MDQIRRTSEDLHNPASGDLVGDLILESRREALASLRSAVLRRSGPVLLTGEAGVGKTWLWRQLVSRLSSSWRWIGVDLSPADVPTDLYRLIAHALGFGGVEGLRGTRTALAEFLEERSADGEAWGLVVDEAQSVSREVLEEIRILTNRLGTNNGFAALILVGHTGLARRIVTPIHEALAVRLVEHIHLRPLDVDEAARLIAEASPAFRDDRETLERLHRDSGGNPKRLLNWVSRQRSLAAPFHSRPQPTPSLPRSEPIAPVLEPAEPEESRPAPVLGPPKPPLHVEEGLIEVGWEPSSDLDTDPDVEAISLERPSGNESLDGPAEEMVDDRYAALQAWTEWARNQGRTPAGESRDLVDSGELSSVTTPGAVPTGSTVPAMANGLAFWADQQHGFAPYSQLFSRLKPSKDKT